MTRAAPVPALAAPAARLAVLSLVVLFVAYRWWGRLEPLNSDDLRLVQFAADFLAGDHWLRGAGPAASPGHAELRIGILPVLAPAVALLGPGELAYYLVPLLFAVVGFAATWALMHRHLDARLAALFALFHVVHPFELQHASLLLVDLPSAACLVVATLLLGERSLRPRASLLWAAGSGLFALEAYLLRANSLLLFAPVVLVLAIRRRERLAAAVAAGVLAAGVLGEQLLLMARGLGFGYRWRAVTEAVEGFGRFLPHYTPAEFLTRQLEFLWARFGRGLDGALAVSLLLLALAALATMLLAERSAILRAVAASGLCAWLLFAFGFSSWSDGSIHALAPPNFRYFQPFYYAATVGLCWLCLRLAAARRPARPPGEAAAVAGWRRPAAWAVAVALVLVAARLSTVHLDERLAHPEGRLAGQLAVLDGAAAAAGGRLEVAATPSSARVLALFRSESTEPAVSWRLSSLPALLRTATRRDVALLVDRPRLETDLRYAPRPRRERLTGDLTAMQRRLCSQRTPLGAAGGVALYAAKGSAPRGRVLLAASPRLVDPARGRLRRWALLAPVGIESSRRTGLVLRPRRGLSEWSLSTGPEAGLTVPPVPSPRSRLTGGEGYALRICLGEMTGVRAAAFLIQYDERRRLETLRQPLWEGDNLLAFRARASARTFRVAINFRVSGGARHPAAVIHRVELLPGR